MSRPRIGITGVTRAREGGEITGVNANYVCAVIAAGGLPVILTPELDQASAVELFGECDALLLTGGEDVDPARYGAAPLPELGTVSAARDANELALFAEARVRDLPILGICRGIQVVNVACGGTLFQYLPTQRPGTTNHDPGGSRQQHSHDVMLEPESRLARIHGATTLQANSYHHQGIDQLGGGLLATAHAPDGLIEGVEAADSAEWLIAVQWHPEELCGNIDAEHLKLFAALVATARRAR
ncbi:MAG: gamma-glutamyl-gamma-aminobutyrate hydrolase family protein [Gemmatimonadales bacterium]|nr:gamma-glutamyl-gamma-aminobutyrate hydrolase family protein [Gemmatimonadales bacterium]